MEKQILNAGKNTLIVFSKNQVVTQLNSTGVNKLSIILDLLQNRAEEMEDGEREMLYGTLVDCFEMEAYFTDEKTTHDVEPRNLEVVQDFKGEFDDCTVIAFGYLNSSDCFISPEELEILNEDLNWLMKTEDFNKYKDETKEFIAELVEDIRCELNYIENGMDTNGYVIKGL